MAAFDLSGALRRIRRLADLSQRELAALIDSSKSAVAAAETGGAGLDVRLLVRAASLAQLRLALLDGEGREVPGMAAGAVRDMARRRFPAHLDTRHSDEGWWHDDHRYSRPRPWYTFTRDRTWRDRVRTRTGVPDDHLLPQAGDSPDDRARARRSAARARRVRSTEDAWHRRLERRRTAGEPLRDDGFECTCPLRCDELDDRSGPPVHAEDCPCSCDLA